MRARPLRPISTLLLATLAFLLVGFFTISLNNSVSHVFAESWVGSTIHTTALPENHLLPQISVLSENSFLATYTHYKSASDGELVFAKSTDRGETWTNVVVDDTRNIFPFKSIVVENATTYLIAYYDRTNLDLRYAVSSDSGANWSTGIIESTGDVGSFVSAANCGVDCYVVAYEDETNDNLRFAKTTDGGSTWTPSEIDATGEVGGPLSIAVDTTDSNTTYYIVSYYDTTNTNLKFALSDDEGATWTTSTIESTGDAGLYSSLAVDIAGNYIVSYIAVNEDERALRFARSLDKGVQWSAQTIDITGTINQETSIATDGDGNYYITYFWTTPERTVRMAKSENQGTSWTKTTIDAQDISNSGLALATNANNPYISYNKCTSINCFLTFIEGNATGDLNGDSTVSVTDYSLFVIDYLAFIDDGTLNIRSDFNGDGTISVSDYALFIIAYLDYVGS